MDQPHAEPFLEPRHARAHGGLRDAERPCSIAERPRLHHASEESHAKNVVGARAHGHHLLSAHRVTLRHAVPSASRMLAMAPIRVDPGKIREFEDEKSFYSWL